MKPEAPGASASQPQQDAAKKWHEEFGKKSLDIISAKWNEQLLRNKQEFETGAKQLQTYELKLLKQIKAIEQIQNQSEQVMNQYKANIRHLTDINVQQDAVIDELEEIESELDNLLPQYEHDPEIQSLIQSGATGGFNSEGPLREQVFRNAGRIDHEIDELNANLVEVQQKIDSLMMKNNA